MVAYVVGMTVASTAQDLVANTVVNSSAANIPMGNSVTGSTVVNLTGVSIPAGSLVAANIPAASIAVASMVSVAATVNTATEAERPRCYFANKLSGTPVPESWHAGEWSAS
jgi:hypothetical protein